jgi:hypothetical protein
MAVSLPEGMIAASTIPAFEVLENDEFPSGGLDESR